MNEINNDDSKTFLMDINDVVNDNINNNINNISKKDYENNIRFDPLGEEENDKIWERMKLLRLKSSIDKKVTFAAESEVNNDAGINKIDDIDKMISAQTTLWKSFKNNKDNELFLP